MAQSKTSIEWTDSTWSPTTGCDQVSPGCDHCYALTMAKRLKAMELGRIELGADPAKARYQTDGDPRTSGPGFGLAMHPDALDQPLRWTKPRRIFVNSMSDLFHPKVTDEFLARVFAVMALAPQHTFQVLTKRAPRMQSRMADETFQEAVERRWSDADSIRQRRAIIDGRANHGPGLWEWPLPNVWLGVSVEDQQRADERIPRLLDTPAAVRFLSCEPLLGPVDLHGRDDGLHNWLPDFGPEYDDGSGEPACQAHGIANCEQGCAFIDWVIVGGESGKGARPMHPDWARKLRDQCTAADVPFLFKQWGEWTPGDGPARHYFGDGTIMHRAGKKAAGRELDGRTWDEYPA